MHFHHFEFCLFCFADAQALQGETSQIGRFDYIEAVTDCSTSIRSIITSIQLQEYRVLFSGIIWKQFAMDWYPRCVQRYAEQG